MDRNWILTNKQIIKALQLHGIPGIQEANGRVYVNDEYKNIYTGVWTTEKIDLTGYTLQQLRDWLGY